MNMLASEGGSSRGYAKKVKVGDIWYKVSAGAFNAQAEVVASRLAKYTNVGKAVEYEMCLVNGCYATMSGDFLRGRESETVKSLHAKVTGEPIEPMLETMQGERLFEYVKNIVLRGIGLDMTETDIFRQLSLLLRFDALVMNDDRHFNNVKFVYSAGKWELTPAYDFDCSFFSCAEDLGNLSYENARAKPFFDTHEEQLKWLNTMSEDRLEVRMFDVNELTKGAWEDKHQIGKKEVEGYLRYVLENKAKKNKGGR
jgi:hypothetical protein